MERTTRIWLALGTVYLVWGSTYLAIMVGIRTLPPLLMSSVRFALAGGILFAWSIRRGDRVVDRPRASQWLAAAAIGGLLLVLGNGGIAWAQQQNTYSVTASVSPSKKGSKAKPLPVGVKFNYKVDEATGKQPSAVGPHTP